MTAPRIIAYYLPQFHPIAENDGWWGGGFTEWTHVAAARPLFAGHVQPRLPAELGFYDLRLPQVRASQANLARHYGVYGFCYWHYWFAGRRLLERPLEAVLSEREPEFPFMIGWANESWSGVWIGKPGELLLEQTYPGRADDIAHFETLLPFLEDPRYIRIGGLPAVLIYRSRQIPHLASFVETWRERARRHGLGGIWFIDYEEDARSHAGAGAMDATATLRTPWMTHRRRRVGADEGPRTLDHGEFCDAVRTFIEAGSANGARRIRYPTVVPRWDDTPRVQRRGTVLTAETAHGFARQLRAATRAVRHARPEDRIIFVKSWNEWAEGNYLEPDRVSGHEFLLTLAEHTSGHRAPPPASWLVH